MVVGLIEDGVDAATDAGAAALDVPADAVNTTMGACEGGNCGAFGEIDRTLDPRGSDEEDFSDDSGLWAGVGAGRGATTAAAGEVGSVATDPVLAAFGLESWTREGERQQQEQQAEQMDEYQNMLQQQQQRREQAQQ